VGATVALMTSPLMAQQAAADKPSADVNRSGNQHAAQQADEPTFFGVVIDPVHPIHPALAAQFQDLLAKNQGLVVERVAHDSPAAKAGIKQYDILTSFGDQKLFSTEQLLNLVRAEKPGAKVAFTVLRNGKSEKVEVTFEAMTERERPLAREESAERPMHRGGHWTHGDLARPHGLAGVHRGSGNAEWERFDSLSLEKTGKDQFKVSIRYLNDKGKAEEHQFTGTREQIHKDIQKEKDLPGSERAHLMRALNISDNSSFAFPGVRFVPGEGLVIDLNQFAPDESQSPHPDSSGQF
jgi:hypothetical protein